MQLYIKCWWQSLYWRNLLHCLLAFDYAYAYPVVFLGFICLFQLILISTLIWWSFTVLYRVFNLFRFLVKHVINILSVNIQIFNFWWFLSLLHHSLDHDLYSSLPDIDWHYNYYFQRKDFFKESSFHIYCWHTTVQHYPKIEYKIGFFI